MNKLITAIRLLKNYFFWKHSDKGKKSRKIHQLLFLLNLFPPYSIICWGWIMACNLFPCELLISASRKLTRIGFLHGALRYIRPEDRSRFADRIFADRAAPLASHDRKVGSVVNTLRERGYQGLGQLLPKEDVESVVTFFDGELGFENQSPMQSDGILKRFDMSRTDVSRRERYFSFDHQTSLRCPQIRNLISSKFMRDIADSYLGFDSQLYNLTTFATRPGEGDHYVMRVHRDYDDFRFLTFFVCWTDVDERNGATRYCPRSHISSKAEISQMITLDGRAGSVYAVDTFGLHAGNAELETPRLATWFRFGTIPNLASIQDKLYLMDISE